MSIWIWSQNKSNHRNENPKTHLVQKISKNVKIAILYKTFKFGRALLLTGLR